MVLSIHGLTSWMDTHFPLLCVLLHTVQHTTTHTHTHTHIHATHTHTHTRTRAHARTHARTHTHTHTRTHTHTHRQVPRRISAKCFRRWSQLPSLVNQILKDFVSSPVIHSSLYTSPSGLSPGHTKAHANTSYHHTAQFENIHTCMNGCVHTTHTHCTLSLIAGTNRRGKRMILSKHHILSLYAAAHPKGDLPPPPPPPTVAHWYTKD